MNKNLKPICLGFAAVLMSASLLQAEEAQEMAIGGGITIANDSLKKVTHNSLGLNFNVSTQMPIAASNVKFRPGLGLSILPGKWGVDNDIDNGLITQSKTQLINIQATFDVMVPLPVAGIENLTVITGLSVNNWRYNGATRDGNPHPYGLQGSAAPGSVKVGLRVGADYRINKQWSSELLLQVVEFGSGNTEVHYHNFNPSWLQLGVKYHF
jgi:hypothetical protein